MDAQTITPFPADIDDVVPEFGGRFFNVSPQSWAEYARNVYSQNGEDGILAEIFDRIGTTNKHCFEVGASDGRWMSNTRRLIDQGWSATLIEPDPERFEELRKLESDKVTVSDRRIEVEGENCLDDVLLENGCPTEPDLGIIDIDGPDYYVLNSMLRIRPRVLLVEFDREGPPDFIPERDKEGIAGWRALYVLGKSKGYHAVAYTRFNIIFVRFEDSARAVRSNQPLKLNLGGGAGPELEGYEVVDRKRGNEIFPLDYPDECADEIYASHCLEHLPHGSTVNAVEDWIRVLKPGGRLRIAVPDLNYIIAQLQAGNRTLPLEGYLFGGQTDGNDFHHACFTENKLRNIMYGLGLRRVRRWDSEIKDCAALPVSLNLEGYKPHDVKVTGVEAVMSVPRYGATAAFECIGQALRVAGNIPLRVAYGAYWDEVLTNAILQTLAGKAEWILFIDFDSVFDADDVKELYRLATTTPGVDAVCPVQIGRTFNKALMVLKPGEDGTYSDKVDAEEFQRADLMEIESGHFGCTLVRADAIRKMSKPWFLAHPAKDGSWAGENYVAADVNFWRKFTAEGFKLCSANQVAIGHIQEMLLWSDRNLQCVTQEISDYRKHGRPPEAWR